MNAPKLTDIAARIFAHLRRMEQDKAINVAPPGRLHPYYGVNAWRAGRYVGVRYVSFQHDSMLTRDDALAYLAWLDDGNNGRHYEQQRAEAGP